MAPLCTPGRELRSILEKTGRSLRGLEGLDKLDMLNLIADQVKDKIVHGKRMNLKLSELNSLLEREGLAVNHTKVDAKNSIQQLLELRSQQLKRLGSYVVPRHSSASSESTGDRDTGFKHALVVMPESKVNDSFALEGEVLRNKPSLASSAYSLADDAVSGEAKRKEVEGDQHSLPESKLPRVKAEPSKPCQSQPSSGSTLIGSLSSELQELLAGVSSKEIMSALGDAATDEGAPENDPKQTDMIQLRAQAAHEVNRLLSVQSLKEVLGEKSWDVRKRNFQRLAKLLHPDKGVVDSRDHRASLALRLAIAAFNKARQSQ